MILSIDAVSADATTLLLGTAMLVLTLVLPCQGSATVATRLAVAQSAALALAVLARALAGGSRALVGLAVLIVLAKILAMPRLLRPLFPERSAADGSVACPLAILAAGVALAVLAFVAVPPVAGVRPAALTLALAMLLPGLLPSVLGHAEPRRFLGLLVAENGVMLAAIALPKATSPLLLELAAIGVLCTVLLTQRRESVPARSSPGAGA